MKTRSRSRIEIKDDRLSDLPQDILHQIFSETDIEDVARTSILSKKWRYFWRSHPFLHFISSPKARNNEPLGNDPTRNFDDFVSHVLTFHTSPKINSLKVYSYGCCRKTHILSWVTFALQRGVEQLYLHNSMPSFDSLLLPTPFFTSNTLTILHLDFNQTNHWSRVELPLPDSINLPRLQQLSLQAMAKLNTKFLDSLFLGCPALETLLVQECLIDQSTNLLISSVRLKHFLIYGCKTDKDDLYQTPLTIFAPNLVSFSCVSCNFNAYNLANLSSLETVDLGITGIGYRYATQEQNAKRLIKCLEGICNVKFLTLANDSLMEISITLNVFKRPSLLFSNLRHLKVTAQISKAHLQAIKYMLETSPELESLFIRRLGGENNPLNIAEELPLQHVKFIQVIQYSEDLEFVKILLKNATILEKMTFVCRYKSLYLRKRFTNELRECPKASPTVKVSLHLGSGF